MKRFWQAKKENTGLETKGKGPSRKVKKRVIIGISTATAAAVAGTGIYLVGKKNMVRADSGDSVQEATAQTGDVENTITGTGTLQNGTGDSITVPAGLTYTEVCVASGDTVTAGQTLAKVDHDSVLSAKSDVQDQIDAIDEELTDLADGESETVTSGVAGTVTAIYGSADDTVSDVMQESGAILEIAVGGDTDNIIQVTASDGTIASVSVSAGDSVSVGDTLFTVTVGTGSEQYEELLTQRKELTEELQKLITIGETDTITADQDGTISAVNISAESSSASGTSASSGTSSAASGTSQSGSSSAVAASYQISSAGAAVLTADTETSQDTAASSSTGSSQTVNLTLDLGTMLTAPSAGETAVTALPSSESYTSELVWTTTEDLEDGDDTNNTAVTTFQADTAYSASIRLTAADGVSFGTVSFTDVPDGVTYQYHADGSVCTITVNYPATGSGTSSGSGENSADSSKNTGDTSDSSSSGTSGTSSGNAGSSSSGMTENSGTSGSAVGGNSGLSSGTGGSQQSGSGTAGTQTVSGSGSGSGGTTTSDTTESTGTSDSTDSSSTTSQSSSSLETTAFTYADADTMTMSVSVDELDINSVSVGQEAQVTVDAIDGQTFTGTVTSVSNTASSSGNGSAKYVVEISIPKDSSMKTGMSASATIVVESSEDVITIPVNALQEKGGSSYVYISVDADGNLSGETEVQTGLSDGDTVEITDGLSEGDTVYYEKTGNTSSGSGQQSAGGDMPSGGNGEMPSGDMPSGDNGGTMPSGDNGGGMAGGNGGPGGQ